MSRAILGPAKAAVEFNARQPGPAKAAAAFKGQQRVPDKTAVESSGQLPVPDRTAVEFNDQLVLGKMEEESNDQRDQDRTAAASNCAPIVDLMAVVGPTAIGDRTATVARTGAPIGPARAAAERAGIATTGPIIGPIGSPIGIDGKIGDRSIAMTFGIIGATIGPTTTIGLTMIGGTTITIPISIGTRT
jgi:hypothetical protein